jgi:hypothetical protein
MFAKEGRSRREKRRLKSLECLKKTLSLDFCEGNISPAFASPLPSPPITCTSLAL